MRNRCFRFYLLLMAAVFCAGIIMPITVFAAAGERKSPTLVLELANSNENTFSGGEFVSILKGNVVFTYDDIRIRSDEATWWRNEGMVDFRKQVKVTRGASTLTCDRMHFTKKTNLITAKGKFDFFDTLEQTRLTGKEAEYHVQNRNFILRGNPKMVRFDTTASETLTISGITMSYSDSLKRATVKDSVKITKGPLTSKCRFAHYFTETNSAQLRGNPRVTYEMHQVTGDSIDLVFGKETLRSALVTGHSHGFYVDTSGAGNDTGYTHIWGDSLYMTVSDSGMLDTLWSYGKALSKYFTSNKPDLVNEASGKVMLMSFAERGNVDRVKIWGNARSKYYIEEDDNSGTNEASGDSILVAFRKGKASLLTLAGRARGVYFPRGM